jgi:hypothetical protein
MVAPTSALPDLYVLERCDKRTRSVGQADSIPQCPLTGWRAVFPMPQECLKGLKSCQIVGTQILEETNTFHCSLNMHNFGQRQALMAPVNGTNGSRLQHNPFLPLIAFSQIFVLPGANNGEPRREGQGLLATGQRNVHPPVVKLKWNGADGAHTVDQQQRGVPGPIWNQKPHTRSHSCTLVHIL